ncbi:hypothetical protein R6Q59_014248 [Mikania micrantha]
MDEITSSIKEYRRIPKSADKSFAISMHRRGPFLQSPMRIRGLDGFGWKVNPIIKQEIRNSIVDLARVSSNALYLINHLSV